MGKVLKRNEVKFTKNFEGEPSGIYLYAHKRATDGSIFYIGKGVRDRYRCTNRTNKYWQNTAKKYGVIVEIIEQNLQDWYAFEREVELIAYYGRSDTNSGCLVNADDGGSGGKKAHVKTYSFTNYKTDEMFTGTKQQFKIKHGFHPYQLINTKNYHLNGWYLNENLSADMLNKLIKGTTRNSSEVYDFVNFKTGQELTATLSEFKQITKVNPSHIIVGRKNSNHGWTTKDIINKVGLKKVQEPFHDRYDDLPIYSFYNFESDSIFIGTRVEFTRKYNVNIGVLFNTNGSIKYTNGWSILQDKEELLLRHPLLIRYTFKHKCGEVFTGTRRQFKAKFQIDIDSLFQTRKAKTCLGWFIA